MNCLIEIALIVYLAMGFAGGLFVMWVHMKDFK